jgi:hypothetical protein
MAGTKEAYAFTALMSASSAPGNTQQKGRHERMHPTLKKEATRPAGRDFLQQQAKFDRLERPHQALSMKYPAEL